MVRDANHAAGWARSDALNKLTWIVICKGGLVRDITVGDCVELTGALQEHHFPGQRGQALVLRDAEEGWRASGCGARAVAGAPAGWPPQR